MKLKLSRDEARCVQHNMFPYLLSWCDMQVVHTGTDQGQNLVARIIRCVARDIKLKLDKRLMGFANKFSFQFNECEVIVFYKLLLLMPIEIHEVWMLQVRQFILNQLHLYLNEPEITLGQLT